MNQIERMLFCNRTGWKTYLPLHQPTTRVAIRVTSKAVENCTWETSRTGKKNYIYKYIQSNLDYPDSLGPHEIVRIIENMNINESKTDWFKRTTFNRETTLLQIIWNTMSSASLFLSFMERTDRLCWGSWINVRDASFFVFHAIEGEISLSNNATLGQS